MAKIGLIGCLIVVVLWTVASTASATVFTLTTKLCVARELCFEASPTSGLLLEGKQSITTKQMTTATFRSPSLGLGWQCKMAAAPGEITQTVPSSPTLIITMELKECSMTGEIAKECKIPPNLTTVSLKGELTTEGELLLKPSSGTTWFEFEFENNGAETCPGSLSGKQKLSGEQVYSFVEPATAQETKEVTSLAVSKLKFFGGALELEQSLVVTFTGLSDNVYLELGELTFVDPESPLSIVVENTSQFNVKLTGNTSSTVKASITEGAGSFTVPLGGTCAEKGISSPGGSCSLRIKCTGKAGDKGTVTVRATGIGVKSAVRKLECV